MKTNYQNVFEFMTSFNQEVPTRIKIPDFETRKLRASLIFEETMEKVAALGLCIKVTRPSGDYVYLDDTLSDYKYIDEASCDIVGLVDAIVDVDVVNKGTAIAFGITEPCLCELEQEVSRSNMSKLWSQQEQYKDGDRITSLEFTQVKDARPWDVDAKIYCAQNSDGKVIKSPSYSPANLIPILLKYGYQAE